MNLNQITQVKDHLTKLQALGLSGEESLEQFVGMAQVAGPELAEYLGVKIPDLVETVSQSMSSAAQVPMQALEQIRQGSYTLGVDLDKIPSSTRAFNISLPSAVVPPNVNLINEMPPIRNQICR
ncbi:MAG TPA: hypothetical protein PKE69_15910, partial [Pyrinomonadaceae bacterium]|nr:hypothetical protein [Pyrinomonadaceae bacterium]